MLVFSPIQTHIYDSGIEITIVEIAILWQPMQHGDGSYFGTTTENYECWKPTATASNPVEMYTVVQGTWTGINGVEK